MRRSLRISLTSLSFLILLAGTGVFVGSHHCPPSGIAFTSERREFHRLKNRITVPRPEDFDQNVTLTSLLQPGDDTFRWSNQRAARLEGYVVAVNAAGVELANCYVRRDIHINIATRREAPVTEQIVVEITPRLADQARARGQDWSEEALQKLLLNRWCYFEGWLMFDQTHAKESENIVPGRQGNWRATAWELHPVTNFGVIR